MNLKIKVLIISLSSYWFGVLAGRCLPQWLDMLINGTVMYLVMLIMIICVLYLLIFSSPFFEGE